MTGWRVGYVVAPSAACVKKMAQMNEAIASCVSSFSQVAAAEALKSTECVEQMVADYTRRRDILIDGINAIPDVWEAIEDGTMAGSVMTSPYKEATAVIDMVKNIVAGKDPLEGTDLVWGEFGKDIRISDVAIRLENLEVAQSDYNHCM